MRKSLLKIIILCSTIVLSLPLMAQVTSASQEAFPEVERSVYYSVNDSGLYLPITWGLDLAWLSEDNIRRGIAFMEQENVKVIRSSFMPTIPLNDGELQGDALTNTNLRMNIIETHLGHSPKIVLNCDHPTVDNYFLESASNWASLIDVTTRMHQERGFEVISVSPFNEPDYGWGQGSIDDFYAIIGELKKISRFDNIRISGGNTLNCDEAANWYNYLNPAGLTEGNTHQLAGSFDNYASFFELVRSQGDHATADELHNVMEAMVGVEYGMQTGIWWGTAEYARGQYVQASNGRRLGYSEHRPNWTAASVYRHPSGKVQGFVGSSERQAVTTNYRFLSKDKDVYYDGHGPQREYIIEVPGGTGYEVGQTNAEGLVNITWGDDIQPVVDGQYKIMNKKSAKVIDVVSSSLNSGANIVQSSSSTSRSQYWNVKPVSHRVGGDFSYFSIINARSGKSLDVLNWSLDSGTDIIQWDHAGGVNQQWYLQYAYDGWFYIRSRHSAKCLEVQSASTASNMSIVQADVDGGSHQLWRFVPTDASVELTAPARPMQLRVSPSMSSLRLEWQANAEHDLSGYTILRSQTTDGDYDVIARDVTTSIFVDNRVLAGQTYYYKIKALDKALNSSAYSDVVSATVTTNHQLVARFEFEDNVEDSSLNYVQTQTYGGCTYGDSHNDTKALQLNGDDAFVQLPPDIVKGSAMSVATWVKWNGGAPWARIFDFGIDQEHYVYLTPRMHYVINDGSGEQRLETSSLPRGEWAHVVLTIDSTEVKIYADGELVAQSNTISINPFDFKPCINYIGRSQFPTLMLDASLDDFKIYNFSLSADDVKVLYTQGQIVQSLDKNNLDAVRIWPMPMQDEMFVSCPDVVSKCDIKVYDLSGKMILSHRIYSNEKAYIDVSQLAQGVYPVLLSSEQGQVFRKIIKQ